MSKQLTSKYRVVVSPHQLSRACDDLRDSQVALVEGARSNENDVHKERDDDVQGEDETDECNRVYKVAENARA